VKIRRAVGPTWPEIQAKAIRNATRKALNRSAGTIRTRAGREVAKDMGLKVRDVRESTDVRRARRTELKTTITARGRPLNLIRFRAREAKGKVRGVRAKAWGVARFYPGMWIGNGGRTVFVRTNRGSRKVRGGFGPGVANTFLERVRSPEFRALYAERFRLELDRAYAFELKKVQVE
jgi:hypothetical protein